MWSSAAAAVALCATGVMVVFVTRGPVSPGTATMFPPPQTRGVARQVASVEPQSRRLMARRWQRQGTEPDDTGFAQWLAHTLPAPPPKSERLQEARRLEPMAATRTGQGIANATWLDDHGHADVWTSLAADLHTNTQTELRDLLDFSAQVSSELKSQYGAASPYVLDPLLRADKTGGTTDGECVCSYPSSHATDSAAARTFLAHFHIDQNLLQRWEAEIDYSRLYVAGHIPSDLQAGALLGDMIGQYFLVTRGREPVPAAPG